MTLVGHSLGAWNERFDLNKLDALAKAPSSLGFASIFAIDLVSRHYPAYSRQSIWSGGRSNTLPALTNIADKILDFLGPDFDHITKLIHFAQRARFLLRSARGLQ